MDEREESSVDESEEELSESSEENIDSDSDSLYSPTPSPSEVHVHVPLKVRPVVLPNEMFFGELSQLQKFVDTLNKIRGCKTPGCKGDLVPVWVTTRGLGGCVSVNYLCNGCASNPAEFESGVKLHDGGRTKNRISKCLQVAFITAGQTHAVYQKTLKHALGIRTVDRSTFTDTIECMHPVVKGVLDEMCETAKDEMKKLDDGQLGSWKQAVTTADGTWQTRGWHSKNATFTIRNYYTNALLYYHHICQKGSTRVTGGELYAGTSKSAEGYAARITFQKAKSEGMQIAVHWQDADSSSAKGVKEVFPKAEIMVCGGHAGRAHRKILEKRQKMKTFTNKQIKKYESTFPNMTKDGYKECKCTGNHRAGCGCLSDAFVQKAHTFFTSTLMVVQSQEELVRRLKALPKHARDEHEWEGGRCEFHALRVCSCGNCENADQILCEGKAFKNHIKLTCNFHALLYEIECHERAGQADKLIHPIVKRGHSNACEASHNVLIRFRSKDIPLETMHYHVSTNLGLIQANLTYMNNKLGTGYHWMPKLFDEMKLPVFDNVKKALEMYNVERMKRLCKAKTTLVKKRRIELKRQRVQDGFKHQAWSKMHGNDTYGGNGDVDSYDKEDNVGRTKGKATKMPKNRCEGAKKRCGACGSTTHQRSSQAEMRLIISLVRPLLSLGAKINLI